MLKSSTMIALVVVVISLTAAGVYVFATNYGTQNATSTTSFSNTSTSTYSSSCESRPTTSTASTVSTNSFTSTSTAEASTTSVVSATASSTTASSQTVSGMFNFNPAYPVSVKSVQAIVSRNQSGGGYVTFSVSLRNVGNASIYIIKGCGSSLDSTILNSSIIRAVPGKPLCLCAETLAPLGANQNQTLSTPGCWSGYVYELTGSGTANVNFILKWGSTNQSYSSSDSVSIDATFRF